MTEFEALCMMSAMIYSGKLNSPYFGGNEETVVRSAFRLYHEIERVICMDKDERKQYLNLSKDKET